MRPEYEIGSIVLVDDTAYDSADPKVGDVAVYQTGNRQVLHRIVDIDENGDYIFEGFNWIAPLVRKIRHLSDI